MTTGPVRVFGVPHLPTAARAVAPTIFTNIATLSSADSAHLSQLAAGETWAPMHLLQKTLLTMRQWILNAMAADAALTPLGGNPGNMANVNLTGDLSLSETAGGARFVLTLTSIGAIEANTISSLTLNNASGALTPLGLVEDGASKTVNAVGGVVTFTGDFQPRTVFMYPRSEQDKGEKRYRDNDTTHPLGDGDVRSFQMGVAYKRRTFTLLMQSPEHAGDSFPVATFSSFGATRKAVNVKALTVNPTSFDAYNALEMVEAHNWITIGSGNWCSRVKQVNATSIDLWEPFPSSHDSTAGQEIRVISEAEAMEMESRRVKKLVIYNQTALTDLPNYGSYSVYAPFGDGKYQEPGTHPPTDPVFDWELELLKYSNPGVLTLP